MIDVLMSMHVALQEAGFTTHLASVDQRSIVCFEDEVLTGFGCVFDSPGELLSDWNAVEMSFLRRYALRLRAAGEKAWNVYCIFLCPSAADTVQAREIRWIEEDLNRTRKIAACGLASRGDLVQALLPILPFQYEPVLGAEDATERLLSRIRSIAPKALGVVLDDSVSPADVLSLLIEPA